jgi:hypothetical protein
LAALPFARCRLGAIGRLKARQARGLEVQGRNREAFPNIPSGSFVQ